MEGYESIIILDPNATEEDQQGLLGKFKETVEGQGGQIIHQAPWGRRKLAYPVNKREYGYYHVMYLDQSPEAAHANGQVGGIEQSDARALDQMPQVGADGRVAIPRSGPEHHVDSRCGGSGHGRRYRSAVRKIDEHVRSRQRRGRQLACSQRLLPHLQ